MENLNFDCQNGKGHTRENVPQVPGIAQLPKASDPLDLLLGFLNRELAVQFRLLDRVRARAWLASKSDEEREKLLGMLWMWDARFRRAA